MRGARTLLTDIRALHCSGVSPAPRTDLQEVAQKYDLPARTEFRTEVVSATWDESSSHWVVTVRSLSDQVLRTFTARIVVSCVGALSIPRKCDVPGAEDFKGPLFHSAQWDHSVQLKDKEVVILGNGCTATQIVPEIAPLVKNVTQIVSFAPHCDAARLRC